MIWYQLITKEARYKNSLRDIWKYFKTGYILPTTLSKYAVYDSIKLNVFAIIVTQESNVAHGPLDLSHQHFLFTATCINQMYMYMYVFHNKDISKFHFRFLRIFKIKNKYRFKSDSLYFVYFRQYLPGLALFSSFSTFIFGSCF